MLLQKQMVMCEDRHIGDLMFSQVWTFSCHLGYGNA